MNDQFKIFVGNLNFDTAIEALVEIASKYGEVAESYKPMGKGFAFITFKTKEAVDAAIEGMNGMTVDGRELNVNIARPREERPRGDFGANRGGFRGGNDRGGSTGGFRRDFRR
ncbi:RNA-binding protein [Candidatus Dojkabacteria bacterium]|jgi:RNA recognition motif-containing protein|nr:RNA-binding protein [Candidatus Dojkabacteria bacterium]